MSKNVILSASHLHRTYTSGRARHRVDVKALDDVSIDLERGETLGIIGESGSGKSTLARMLARLESPDNGEIHFDGGEITAVRGKSLAAFRRSVQVVFQDPFESLNPLMKIDEIVTEPLRIQRLLDRSDQSDRAADLLDMVALQPALARRYPYELSGGQRQRVAIARAMALEPTVLIADEPTSALDISTRSEILNLLLDLQTTKGLSILLISHDFATIRHLSHRVAVMYQGKVIEAGTVGEVTERPSEDYTQRLLAAVPTII